MNRCRSEEEVKTSVGREAAEGRDDRRKYGAVSAGDRRTACFRPTQILHNALFTVAISFGRKRILLLLLLLFTALELSLGGSSPYTSADK